LNNLNYAENHIRIANVNKWLCWLYAFVAIFLLIPSYIFKNAYIIYIFWVTLLISSAFLSVLHHYVGKGALKKKSWALIATRAIAVFNLIAFPIGTLIGVYMLYISWHGWKDDVVV